jgi:hypothetical protein
MKRKRVDRDVWWNDNRIKFPNYYQLRVDIDAFHGFVCLILDLTKSWKNSNN